jgi:hypothetical protein
VEVVSLVGERRRIQLITSKEQFSSQRLIILRTKQAEKSFVSLKVLGWVASSLMAKCEYSIQLSSSLFFLLPFLLMILTFLFSAWDWQLGLPVSIPQPIPDPLPSDSRFREDLVALQSGDIDLANDAKIKLENKQRRDAKLRKEGYEKRGQTQQH